MANIFVSIPVHEKPELKMMYSLNQAVSSCRNNSIRVYFNEGDSLISRVRNNHLSAFYYDYPECEYFFSLDSDIEILNCHQDNNLFSKLISHRLEFVGGLYAMKRPEIKMCSSAPMNPDTKMEYNIGVIEMRWLAPGCWCLHRSAVKKIIEAYPDLIYDGEDYVKGKTIHGLYAPYIRYMGDDPDSANHIRRYLGEDFAFCQRWRDIGGKIHADTSIVLRHIGRICYDMWNIQFGT